MTRRAWVATLLALAVVPAGGAVWAARRPERTAFEAMAPSPARIDSPSAASTPTPDAAPRADDSFLGVILAAETTEVSARVDGRIESMHVHLGDHVAAGAPIASMDKRALQRELATLRAGAKALSAEADRSGVLLTQAGALLDHRRSAADAISGEELASAQFGDQSAALTLTVAQARVAERRGQIAQLEQRLDDAEVRAPFEGIVAARYVDRGATVARGVPLIRLVGVGDPRVRFAIPEGAAEGAAPGASIVVAIPGEPDVLDAEVEKLAPEVDAASRVTYAEARFVAPIPASLGTALAGRVVHVRRRAASARRP